MSEDDLFRSSSPDDVLSFYDRFSKAQDLIRWLRDRPVGPATIGEASGKRNTVVVIPTPDMDGKYAIHCRDSVFRGQHIVFVESGGVNDACFRYARNANLGLVRALELAPDWIILANDDVYEVDPISNLVRQLDSMDSETSTIVYPLPSGHYYTSPCVVGRRTRLLRSVRRFGFMGGANLESCLGKFDARVEIRCPSGPKQFVDYALFLGGARVLLNFGSFGVFSARFLEATNGRLFDETYLNGYEDVDASLRLDSPMIKTVKFRVGCHEGAVLGSGPARAFRDIANVAYFNFKMFRDRSLKLPRRRWSPAYLHSGSSWDSAWKRGAVPPSASGNS